MKKFIFMMVSILTLTLVSSCSSCSKQTDVVDEPTVTVEGVAFDFNLRADYDLLSAEHPNIKFFESTAVLNGGVDSLQNFEVVSMESVYQIPDSVIKVQYNDSTREVSQGYGHWMEDCEILPEHVVLSLAEAIEALQESNIVIPSSHMVVLRRPLGPKVLTSAYYIFGTLHTGFVAVDAVNGEVLPMEELFKEEETLELVEEEVADTNAVAV